LRLHSRTGRVRVARRASRSGRLGARQVVVDQALVWLHLAALAAWAILLLYSQGRLLAARHRGPDDELAARRSLRRLLEAEHALLLLALATGLALMIGRGWAPRYARWFGLKLGLVVFLLIPLEAMHAYVTHVWIARGLRETAAAPFSKDLARGIGMEDMLRALAIPLLGIAVPLLVWLSVFKPF
jgi:hypothetical protein